MMDFKRCIGVGAICALSSLPVPAQAASTKTWVSSNGTDSGTCALTAPCRTFQYAHDQTASAGEIDVRDSGGYGQLTITKPISIVAADGLATVGVPQSGAGITISAGIDDRVLLRGLFIDGHQLGDVGIRVSGARHVAIEHCIVTGTTTGILASSGFVAITDTVVTNTGKGLVSASSANVYISGNVITGNTIGLSGSFASYGDNVINGSGSCDTCSASFRSASKF